MSYEIRDCVHGFIPINEWERDIINTDIFQRLRRIKQLAWTDTVYPGACHNRFEHSLGVMHVATKMFEHIVEKAYKHEQYSAAIVRFLLKDVIESHPDNQNYNITAEEIAQFIEGSRPKFGRVLLWRELLSSQLDADRADYLLRDSYHCGVTYGHYDLNRLYTTLNIGLSDTGSPIVAIKEGGLHVAEALILARYQMFTQVYFHHTRRAYDYHTSKLLKVLLMEEQKNNSSIKPENKDKFPPPDSVENLNNYIQWDDWKVQGLIAAGHGGEFAEIVKQRNHYRRVYWTKEVPSQEELEYIKEIGQNLEKAKIPGFTDNATKSWYKLGQEDIAVCSEEGAGKSTIPLSSYSSMVKSIAPIMQYRIYVPPERKSEAIEIINKLRRKEK